MNEVQFVQRLQQVLGDTQHWPEIHRVSSTTEDTTLAANELLVYPHSPVQGQPVVLHVTVEALSPPVSTGTLP